MATITYECNANKYFPISSWSNQDNIVDSTASTYAEIEFNRSVEPELTDATFVYYDSTSVYDSTSITQIDIGVKGYRDTYFYDLYVTMAPKTLVDDWISDSTSSDLLFEMVDSYPISRVPCDETSSTIWSYVADSRITGGSDILDYYIILFSFTRHPTSITSDNDKCYVDSVYWRITYT
jgi:hypothetical protein